MKENDQYRRNSDVWGHKEWGVVMLGLIGCVGVV